MTERQLAPPIVQSPRPALGLVFFLFLGKLTGKNVVEGMSRTEQTPPGYAKHLSACPRHMFKHVLTIFCLDHDLPSWLEGLPKFTKGFLLVVVQWLPCHYSSKTSKDKNREQRQNKRSYKHTSATCIIMIMITYHCITQVNQAKAGA